MSTLCASLTCVTSIRLYQSFISAIASVVKESIIQKGPEDAAVADFKDDTWLGVLALIYSVVGDSLQPPHMVITCSQQLSAVGVLAPRSWFVMGCLYIGEPPLNALPLCPSWEGQHIPERCKALKHPRVTNRVNAIAPYRGLGLFTSSLRSCTWTCLTPAFLTKESHVPHHGR